MAKFESSVKQIPYAQQSVFNVLSDLNNLERIRNRVPKDKLQNFSFDHDSVSVSVAPVGQITLRICEREEPKCIKFESVQSPLAFHLWIQILPTAENASKMRVTIDADIPLMLRAMVSGPLQEGVEKMADALAAIPYEV